MATVRLEDITPNSHVSKESRKPPKDRVTPVVHKDSIASTKKPLSQKFADTFITEDVDDVKSWLLMDVIIPGIKNTILDMLSMMFFGGRTYGSRGNRSRGYYNRDNASYNYNAYYKSDYSRQNDHTSPQISNNGKVDYRNIVFKRREDAERVVDEMHRRIADFGEVSIGEMLDLMEITGKYTDMNWGWRDPRDIGIRRISSGFLIDVAEAKLLD